MKPKSKQESEHGAVYAKGGKGGSNKMVKPQSAEEAKSGRTGKIQSAAPGAKRAIGGSRTTGHSLSTPAQPGHTSPPRKGR